MVVADEDEIDRRQIREWNRRLRCSSKRLEADRRAVSVPNRVSQDREPIDLDEISAVPDPHCRGALLYKWLGRCGIGEMGWGR